MNKLNGNENPMAFTPKFLAHVVYRTRRFAGMLNWYSTVFGAKGSTPEPRDELSDLRRRAPSFRVPRPVCDRSGRIRAGINPVGVEFDPGQCAALSRCEPLIT